jgi:hypothetical protein
MGRVSKAAAKKNKKPVPATKVQMSRKKAVVGKSGAKGKEIDLSAVVIEETTLRDESEEEEEEEEEVEEEEEEEEEEEIDEESFMEEKMVKKNAEKKSVAVLSTSDSEDLSSEEEEIWGKGLKENISKGSRRHLQRRAARGLRTEERRENPYVRLMEV